jgi:hypothetical protein
MIPSKTGERVKHTASPYYNNGSSMTIESIDNGIARCSFEDDEGNHRTVSIPIGELELLNDASDFMVIF